MKLPVESSCDKDHVVHRSASSIAADRVPPIPIHDRTVDYSEYMWMGEEMEEFDRQCIEQLLEDEFIEDCFEEMLEEEEEVYDLVQWFCEEYEDAEPEFVIECLQNMDNNIEITFLEEPTAVPRSRRHTLNPNAPEFIPRSCHGQAVPHLVSTVSSDTPYDR